MSRTQGATGSFSVGKNKKKIKKNVRSVDRVSRTQGATGSFSVGKKIKKKKKEKENVSLQIPRYLAHRAPQARSLWEKN